MVNFEIIKTCTKSNSKMHCKMCKILNIIRYLQLIASQQLLSI